MKIEETKLRQIEALCKNNKVKSLFAFGSVLRSDFNDASDIDLIVDFDEKDPIKYTDLYFNLKLYSYIRYIKMENILEDIKNKMKLLEEFQRKQKKHSEQCVRYQLNRMNQDESYKKRLYDASREYQKKRYNEDDEFREKKLQQQRDLYTKRKAALKQKKEDQQNGV